MKVKEFVHNGRKLLATRKFQEAVKICRIGLLEDPASVEGRVVLAQALMSLARYDEVIAETRAALELKEDSAPATVLLGEALFFKGAYVQARQSLQRAAELDPENDSVQRLLAELDATAEVGLEEPTDLVGDTTRSYPDANVDPSVGDETEIQDLPAALQEARDHAAEENSSEGAAASRGAVEAANKAAEDQERPDPIAGEVKIGTGEVSVDAAGPSVPEIKVDVSKVDEAPQPDAEAAAEATPEAEPKAAAEATPEADAEATPKTSGESASPVESPPPGDPPETYDVGDETIHTGEIASPSEDADATAAAKKSPLKPPVTPQRDEGSQSGARRWAERKWIGADEAATREALLVPTPRITTEELQDSDLFGRGASPDHGLQRAPRGRSATKEPAKRSVLVEDGTVETKLSRPEPSGPRARPAAQSRDEQPTTAGKAKSGSDPWNDDEDEETRSLRAISGESPDAKEPSIPARSSLSKRQPPPPPSPPVAKSPFRTPGSAGQANLPGAGRRQPGAPPGLPSPARPGAEPPGLPSPGGRPPVPGARPPVPGARPPVPGGRPPVPGAPRPGPPGAAGPAPSQFDNPDFSGVHFEAPPAAPPAGGAGGAPIIPPRPAVPKVQPSPTPPMAPATPRTPYEGLTNPPTPQLPVAAAPAAAVPTAAPAAPTAAPVTAKPTPAGPREHTAPAARYPARNWLQKRWRLVAVGAGVLMLIATVILIVAALRKDGRSETVKKHMKQARSQVETASFRSLKSADEKLLKVLQESSKNKVAKSLRAFVAAVIAVEFGGSADRVEQMLDKGGAKDNDLLAATRVLSALSSGNQKKTAAESKKAARRWPQSPFVAYARGLVTQRQGRPAKSLRILDGVPARRAKILLLRAKIRALLALGQYTDVDKALNAISNKQKKAPWVRLLGMRHRVASTRKALPLKTLDPALSLVADATGRVSPRQKRWAQYLLAEAYGRLGKDAERQRYLTRVLTGGGFQDPALAEAVATHQLKKKATTEAQRLIQTVRRRYPDRLTAVLIEARCTLLQGKYKEVLRQLHSVAELRRTPQMNLLRARAALALGQFPLARKILTKLRKAYPNLTGALIAWAKLLTQEGRLDEALTALENVLKREPRNVEVIRDAARLELRRGKAADAVIRLEVAVRLRARDPELRAELVRAYLAAGRYKSAETAIEAASAAFPNHSAILSGKGQLMQILGNYSKALKAFDAALSKKPKLTDALVGRAEVLLSSGRLNKAAKAVKKAIKPAPELRRLLRGWLSLERWNKRKSDPWRARTLLSAASRQKGAIGHRAAALLLEYYAKAMSRKTAERMFKQLSQRFGAHVRLRSALALARLDDDSYNGAKAQLNSAMSDPAFSRLSPVTQAQVLARLAHAYWLAGNYGAAGRRAKKALKIWDSCPRALTILGIVAYEVAKFSRAKRHLKRAVEANPNLALAHHYLGKSYKQLGQRRAARRHLHRYLRLRPKGPLASDSRRAL